MRVVSTMGLECVLNPSRGDKVRPKAIIIERDDTPKEDRSLRPQRIPQAKRKIGNIIALDRFGEEGERKRLQSSLWISLKVTRLLRCTGVRCPVNEGTRELSLWRETHRESPKFAPSQEIHRRRQVSPN